MTQRLDALWRLNRVFYSVVSSHLAGIFTAFFVAKTHHVVSNVKLDLLGNFLIHRLTLAVVQYGQFNMAYDVRDIASCRE